MYERIKTISGKDIYGNSFCVDISKMGLLYSTNIVDNYNSGDTINIEISKN